MAGRRGRRMSLKRYTRRKTGRRKKNREFALFHQSWLKKTRKEKNVKHQWQ